MRAGSELPREESAAPRDVAVWVGELSRREELRDCLRAFWAVYDAHFDEVMAENQRAIAAHPELGRLMRALGPERLGERAAQTRAAARRAIVDEDWRPYLDLMRAQGQGYADLGVSFVSWFESVAAWRALLLPRLVTAAGDGTERFAAASRGMDAFVDVTLAALAEQYLLAKQLQAQRRGEEAAALADAARVLAEGSLARETLGSILEAAMRVVPARVGGLVVPREEGRVLEVVALVGAPQEWIGRRHPATEGIAGRAFQTGEAQRVADVRADPDHAERKDGIRSQLVVPLRAHGRVVGVIELGADEVGRFGEAELRLMEGFAAHAAAALEMERLLRDLTSRESELAAALNESEALALAVRTLAAETGTGDILKGVLAAAQRAVPVSHAMLVIPDREAGEFEVVAVVGASAEWVGRRYALASGLTGRAFRTGEVQLVDDVRNDPDYEAWVEDIRSEMAIPIVGHGEMVGVLNLESPTVGHFGAREARVMRSFAEYAAIALEARRLLLVEQHQKVAEAASRAKSEFLANMSHELRTPLNSILGFSDLLAEQLREQLSEAHGRYLGNVHRSGEHLLELVNDVLDLSKVEAGRLELRVEAVHLASVLEPVVASAKASADPAGLVFEVVVPDDGTVRVDPVRLRQVLDNLLSNAVKFTPRGGTVRLRILFAGEDLVIEVTDTGLGIPASEQHRVFGTFERLHEGRSDAPGTGLGLALTKRLVELHRGSITFESQEGRGTTFRLVLPEARFEPVRGDRLLVVEDAGAGADLIVALATEAGLVSEVVTTARGAIDSVRRDPPRGIVLDLRLPDERGERVLEALKADPRTRGVPVVVVTVEDDDGRSRSLGADDHLTKPVDRQRLLAWLRQLPPWTAKD